MGLLKQQKVDWTLAGLCTNTLPLDSVQGTNASRVLGETGDLGFPSIFVWDPTGPIPQLLTIVAVCRILSLKKSAVYNLVASGLLAPPLKFGASRRATARFLLRDVATFVQTLAEQRLSRPILTVAEDSSADVPSRVNMGSACATRQPRKLHASRPPTKVTP